MVGAQGQTKWAKVAKKSSTYDVTHKKKRTPKQKIFFRVQSTRLADPFELSSAIGGGARVLVRQTKTAVFFLRKPPKPGGSKSVNWINDDAFGSAVTANGWFIIHLVCLFMKVYLLALLQDNCLDLVRCAFLYKLSGCVRNVKAFCQHLLRLIYWWNPNLNFLQLQQCYLCVQCFATNSFL